MGFFDNTRKPTGLGGKVMVSLMNSGHAALADWGLGALGIPDGARILDCGCGGGANIAKLLKEHPDANVIGVDYSDVSVGKSESLNKAAIDAGRCEIIEASVSELPFENARFDIVTAFETVYFWQDLEKCFGEVFRVLKPGGTFFICNECCGAPKGEKWTRIIVGMRVYDENALRTALESVGFSGINAEKNERGWIRVTARK